MLARVIKRYTEEKAPHGVVDVPCQIILLAERVHYIKINGTGLHVTPVADVKTMPLYLLLYYSSTTPTTARACLQVALYR